VSEAFSRGAPVVMSNFTAKSFKFSPESNIGCTGQNADSMKRCILDLHNNQDRWMASRKAGLEWIKQTHSRLKMMKEWKALIQAAHNASKRRRSHHSLGFSIAFPDKSVEQKKHPKFNKRGRKKQDQ